MMYVPIVPPISTGQPPSPRTRELAALLAKVVQEYRNSHPAVTGAEVREALRLARLTTGGGKATVTFAISLALGLLVAGLMAGLVFFRGRGEVGFEPSISMIILAVVVFLGIVLALVKAISR